MTNIQSKKREIKIETIHPMYDVIEDRLRLSFNHKIADKQIDLMMTRKFILQLLPSYEEYMYKVYADRISDSSLHKKIKNKNRRLENHKQLKPYQQDVTLLHGIEFSYIQKNELTRLSFHTNHTKMYVELNYTALIEIFNIIKSTIPYFDWGISSEL